MLIFLYGADDYRREKRKKFYIGEFEKKYSGLSLGVFDLADPAALEELEGFARSESLFEPKKLAVIENFYEADEKRITKVLTPIVPKKETIALISENKKPPKALAFLNKDGAKVEEFENLEGMEWAAFVKKEAENRGVVLSAGAMNFLIEMYAKNSWGLITELDKLANFEVTGPGGRGSVILQKEAISGGKPLEADGRQLSPKKEISREDLESLGLDILPNYWVMINGVKSQSLKNRLFALERLLAQKEPPAKLFNILASQWREKIAAMAEYDFLIKSGKLEYEEALVDAVLS